MNASICVCLVPYDRHFIPTYFIADPFKIK